MKYFILVCLSAFLTIITIGCNDSNSSEGPNLPSSIKELFPLKVGDEWHYDVGNFDSVGNADRYNGLVEIVSSRQLHGKEVFVRTDSVMYYYDGDSNLLWLENAGDSVGSYYIHCPKSIGDPHIMDDTIFSSPSPERFWRVTTLVRTNERLETPAGIFNCWYIETMNFLKKLDQVVPDTTYYSQYWFVKNVGLVRQVGYTWYSGKKTLDYTLWLTKYQLF